MQILYIALLFIITLPISYGQDLQLNNYVKDPNFNPLFYAGAPELSALTFSHHTTTLFAVDNENSSSIDILEISLTGSLLRTISMTGFGDIEGIVHLDGENFAVVEERLHEVIFFTINPSTTTIAKSGSSVVTLTNPDLAFNNLGLEGIAYDAQSNVIYAIKEKSPSEIYSFIRPSFPYPSSIAVAEVFSLGTMSCNFSASANDVSAMEYSARGNLLLASHDDRAIVEVNKTTGAEISAICISDVIQVEGLTTDCNGNLYFVSEGTGLYRYYWDDGKPKIGDFTALTSASQAGEFVIPSTHKFQKLIETNDPLTMGGVMRDYNDFTGYVPIQGSSEMGYLSISHEAPSNQQGGATVMDINFNSASKLWQVSASEVVDFGAYRTTRNCSGAVTPWNSIITCEEYVTTSDASPADGYNDVGWAVELDPATKQIKNKLWAMGNFKHENAIVHCNRRTVYQGADDALGYLYKYVADEAENLNTGNLYVYKGPKSGSGTWELVPNTTQADRNNTVGLSTNLGAEDFDFIEDVDIGHDGLVYFTSKASGTVYRFRDPNPLSGTSIPVMETYVSGIPGADNLTFDCEGNLYILQDGGDNHIWFVRNDNLKAKEIFARTPIGSEPTGMTFTPDCKYMFLSIQHPSGANTANQIDAGGNIVNFNKDVSLVIARKENLGADDTCIDPTTITCGQTIMDNTINGSDIYNTRNSSPNYTGHEITYQFVAPTDMTFDILLSGMTQNLNLFLGTNCGGINLASSVKPGTTNDDIQYSVIGGTTYYITVDALNEAAGPFTLSLNCTTIGCASGALQSRVASSDDDAEEASSLFMDLTSSDLELVDDPGDQGTGQTIGLRFTNLDIPRRAKITNAYIQFTVDEINSVPTTLAIHGQEIGNAPVFFSNQFADIATRQRTINSVPWNNIPSWNTVGAAGVEQRTPDISSIIEEITDRPDWNPTNALVLLLSGTGERVAESYDGSSAQAPLLVVEYLDCNSLCDYVGNATFDASGMLPPGYATVENNIALQGAANIASHNYRYAAGQSVSFYPEVEIGNDIGEFEILIDNCDELNSGACNITQTMVNGLAMIDNINGAGQSFVACNSGAITSIECRIENFMSLTNMTLHIADESNTLNPDYTQGFSHQANGIVKFLLEEPFEVVSGNTYSFSVIVNDPGTTLHVYGYNGDPYVDGSTFTIANGMVTISGSDLFFSVKIRPNP